jgi:hypothetical protein
MKLKMVERFKPPARWIAKQFEGCQSGRLQLAPSGHVRSIVNSVHTSVRKRVRDA